jgi:hypothetical protein
MSNYTGASFISRPTEEILLTKADLVYVDTQLSHKADFDYTNLELNKKASLIFLESELSGKASVFQLSEKVTQIQYDSHVSINEQNITNLYNEQANITQQVNNVQTAIGIRPTTDAFLEAVDILNINIATKVPQDDYNLFLDTNLETNNSILETLASKVSQGDYDTHVALNETEHNTFTTDIASKASNASVELKANINNASLTGNTQMTKLQLNHSDPANIGLIINNTNNNQYMAELNTIGYGMRIFNTSAALNNTTFGVYNNALNPLLVKNDGKLYTLDQEVDGDINLTTGHAFKINGVAIGGGVTQAQLDQKVSIDTQAVRIGLNSTGMANTAFITIGNNAGSSYGPRHIAIGVSSGAGGSSGDDSIAIGSFSCQGGTQGANSINIGPRAGMSIGTGFSGISIGSRSYGTSAIPRTITINATGVDLINNVTNTCRIKPIREETSSLSGFMPMYYNPSTGELVSSNL